MRIGNFKIPISSLGPDWRLLPEDALLAVSQHLPPASNSQEEVDDAVRNLIKVMGEMNEEASLCFSKGIELDYIVLVTRLISL